MHRVNAPGTHTDGTKTEGDKHEHAPQASDSQLHDASTLLGRRVNGTAAEACCCCCDCDRFSATSMLRLTELTTRTTKPPLVAVAAAASLAASFSAWSASSSRSTTSQSAARQEPPLTLRLAPLHMQPLLLKRLGVVGSTRLRYESPTIRFAWNGGCTSTAVGVNSIPACENTPWFSVRPMRPGFGLN